jgi:hypothetical protein
VKQINKNMTPREVVEIIQDYKERKEKNKKIMKLIIIIVIAIIAIPIAFFIGKTKVNGWHIEVERPVTALLFYATILAALIDI